MPQNNKKKKKKKGKRENVATGAASRLDRVEWIGGADTPKGPGQFILGVGIDVSGTPKNPKLFPPVAFLLHPHGALGHKQLHAQNLKLFPLLFFSSTLMVPSCANSCPSRR